MSVGCSVMCEVKGHRCSKKQMPDVSRYTASSADRDIIFIQPEVPFMLIGATERWKGGVKEKIRGGLTAGGKKGAISTMLREGDVEVSKGKSRGRAKDK